MKTLRSRHFIEITFNGSSYHGWQTQPNARTVQELLDGALTTVLRQPVSTTGCGRTDAGVHARQLYAHFDIVDEPNLPDSFDKLRHRINSLLPHDIAVKRLIAVPPDAHARFDAVKRSYEYHIHFEKDPFLYKRSWQLHEKPDVDAMNKAAAYLLEYEDFSCFSKSNTQVATPFCKLTQAEWQWTGKRLVFHISADRFLRNMVRAIVGTLMEIGKKEKPVDHIHTVIASKNRSVAGTSVPAHGLYLTEVMYPYIQP